MPQLQTLEAWTEIVGEDDDFDILLMNLSDAAINIRNLQVNSCLARTFVPGNEPTTKFQKVERLSLIGSPYCKYKRKTENILKDNSSVLNLFVNSLPSLHTLVLYFATADLNIYRNLYRNKGLNIISGDKLIGRETTQYLLFC